MSEQKQCCAPLPNGERCPNNIIDDISSIHCSDHYPKGIRLYKLYKKLCDISKTYDLDKKFTNILERIKYVNKAYYSYFRAYEGRMEHRIYGLVPQCYDDGHNEQFDIILSKIQKSEDLLTTLYDQYFEEKAQLEPLKDLDALEGKVDVDEEVKESGQDLEVTEILNKTKDFKARRADDNQKEKLEIEQYIRENKKLRDKKLPLVNQVITKLKSHMKINPKYEYYQFASIYLMILTIPRVIKSFNTSHEDVNLVIYHKLSGPDFSKYKNITDFLIDQPEPKLREELDIIEKNYKLIKSLFLNAERFWKNDNINISNTLGILARNPYEKKYLMTYTTNNFLSELPNLKTFGQIEKRLGVKGIKFSAPREISEIETSLFQLGINTENMSSSELKEFIKTAKSYAAAKRLAED